MDRVRQLEELLLGHSADTELRNTERHLQEAVQYHDHIRSKIAALDDEGVYESLRCSSDGWFSVQRWETEKRTEKRIYITIDGGFEKRILPREPLESGQPVTVYSRLRCGETFMLGKAAREILEREQADAARRVARWRDRLGEIEDQLQRGEVPLDASRRETANRLAVHFGLAKTPPSETGRLDWRRYGF